MEFTPGILEAFGLYLLRTSALVLGSPLLGLSTGFSATKVGLVAILALTLYAIGGEPLPGGIEPLEYGAMALRELLIGFFLAFCLQVVLVATQVAGELVGHDMGFTLAGQMDPETGVNSSLVPRIFETFLLLGLLALNAHHWLIRALDESFRRAPIGRMQISGHLSEVALRNFAQMFAAGLTFAAPVVVCLALSTVVLGMLARLVPALNIFDLSFQVRILLGLVAMTLFAPLLAPAIDVLSKGLLAGLDRALGAV